MTRRPRASFRGSRFSSRRNTIPIACIALCFVAVLLAPLAGRDGVAAQEPPTSIVVTSTADDEDVTSQDNACVAESGGCTLRAAIQEANRQPGPNTIAFNIPGEGPHTIALTATLPWLSDASGPTIIDGYSQPGAVPNSDPANSIAKIMVQIVGPRTIDNRRSIDGLVVASAGNEIRGLAFTRLKRSIWIRGSEARGTVVAGAFVGIGADGQPWYDDIDAVEHRGGDPGAVGIWLSGGASNNRIGGTTPAERNVISGNANDGIGMRGAATSGNVVIGNIIGLSPDGSRRVRNWGDGIDLNYGTQDTRIGGTEPGERNVISGNHGEGVEISHGTMTIRNVVVGNVIGTGTDGRVADARDFRNSGFGVSLEGDVRDNTIGPGNLIANNDKGGIEIYGQNNLGNQVFGNVIGLDADGAPLPNRGPGVRIRYHAASVTVGPDNRIAHNEGPGILIIDGDVRLTTITRNAIYANAGSGIVVTEEPIASTSDSRTTSLALDTRPGPPSIATPSRTSVGGTTCPNCTVEVFLADAGAEQPGQGKTFAGAGVASSSGTFLIAIDRAPIGSHVTATATSPVGTTSIFAATVAVIATSSEVSPVPVYPRVNPER